MSVTPALKIDVLPAFGPAELPGLPYLIGGTAQL